MEKGKVVESGTHDELFAAEGGAYAKLVNRQLYNDMLPNHPSTVSLHLDT
jgi:hypothetical protein